MTDSKRVIYYYQTFHGHSLEPVLTSDTPVSVLIVSSLHFGSDSGSPYIHLNDNNPDWEGFDTLWSQTHTAQRLGIKVTLMLGGAAGHDYKALFSNFDTYYGMLKDTIQKRPWITGIDLDIEELVSLDNVQMLICRIDSDFGPDFTITMAPVATSLQSDAPSPLSGISYKELFQSTEGKRINWFNAQFYVGWGGFTESSYEKVLANGYPSAKVVMGMQSTADFQQAQQTLKSLSTTHNNNFAGVFNWEYGNTQDPIKWANLMSAGMHSSSDPKECQCCIIL